MTVEPEDAGPQAPAAIVTFYSYRSGVGCSMALANVAWILASAGKKVLVVDWAMETTGPGLQRFLLPFFPDPAVAKDAYGILDLAMDYRWAAREDPTADLGTLWDEYADFGLKTITLGWQDVDIATRVHYLSPGRRDESFAANVEQFSWTRFLESAAGAVYVEKMRQTLRSSEYDYVLIDSTPGALAVTELCTTQLPDVVVTGFQMDAHFIRDSADAARKILDRAKWDIRILPVPMKVFGNEWDNLEHSREFADRQFAGLPPDLDDAERERYWAEIEIPHQGLYETEGVLAALAERAQEKRGLLKSYEWLTREITRGTVTKAIPLPEPQRRSLVGRLRHRPPSFSHTVSIIYSAPDHKWAEWIEWQLSRAGMSVTVSPIRSAAEETGIAVGAEGIGGVTDAETTIVVLSPNLKDSPQAPEVLRLMTDPRPGSETVERHRLVGIRVAEGTLDVFTSILKLDMVLFSEKEARDRLLSYFGWTGPLAPRPGGPARGPRFPGYQPDVRQTPARNRFFVGRDTILHALRQSMIESTSAGVPVALHGPTAIGKSNVALEYVWRFRSDYDVVWWIQAERPQEVRASLAELAQRLELAESTHAYEAVTAVLDALRRGEPSDRWLLVYDDAGEPGELEGLLPADGNGHVLITSRVDAWRDRASLLEVEPFKRRESIDLFLRRTSPRPPKAVAERVAALLHDMPLAIDQAGTWLNDAVRRAEPEGGRPEQMLLDQLSESRPSAADDAEGFALPFERAAAMSLDWLAEHHPAAVRLLQISAFLSPGGIAMHLVKSTKMLELLREIDDRLRSGDITFQEIVHRLAHYVLARVDQQLGRLHVHRMTQRVVRSRRSEAERDAARSMAQQVLAAYAPIDDEMDDSVHDLRYIELQRHVEPAEALEATDSEVRRWLVNQVRFLYRTNNWADALAIAERLESDWAERAEADDPLRLRLRVQLANVLRALGRYAEADKLDAHALRRQAHHHRMDHPFVLMTRRSRGGDLRSLGQFQDAWTQDQAVYMNYREIFGDDHPDTLNAANNLALSLLLTGVPAEALDLDRETFAIRSRVLGDNHELTWRSATQLGVAYREVGDYASAKRRLQEAWNRLNVVAGAGAPSTLRAAKSLAVTLRLDAQADVALREDRKTLNGLHAFLGPEHPDTLACAVSLAADLHATGNVEAALRQGRLNLGDYAEVFGEEHPFTQVCRANLAIYTRASGQPEAARELSERAWQSMRDNAQVGPQHPFTLAAALDHAHVLFALGRLDQALAYETEAYEGFRVQFGDSHPYTQIALANHTDTKSHQTSTGAESARGLHRDIDIEILAT